MSEPSPPPGPATGVPTCYRHPGRETWIRCQRCERPICPDCMRDAAVGFQCPGCVAEGARSTRQGRTAYGGRRSADTSRTSVALIVVNAAVWLLITATGGAASAWVPRLALLPLGQCRDGGGSGYYPNADERVCGAIGGADWVPGVADGALWQLVTSAFAHVDLWHIGFNMLALWVLGPQLEAAVGRVRFLALYLLSALAGSAAVFWLSAPVSTTLGASGAVFGLMGALLVVALKVRGNVSQILTWLGINAVITVVGSSFISWQGHLGGFVGGLVVMAVLVYAPRGSRALWQGVGLGAVLVVLLLLVAARSAVLL